MKGVEISYSLDICDSKGYVIESGIFLFLEDTPTIIRVRNIRELDEMIDELQEIRRKVRYAKRTG